MGIITKGMGAIMKGAKKRKTLTISGPSTPKKRTVIIKKLLGLNVNDGFLLRTGNCFNAFFTG